MVIYLYIKQHIISGLKYFGKTVRNNPYSYLGSGTHWRRHINKHGKEHVITCQVWEFESQEECTNFALEFSLANNIVESKEWANLREENGLDGPPKGYKFSEENKQKRSKYIISDETRRKISESNKGKSKSEEHRKNLSISNKGHLPWNIGQPHSEETKLKISESTKGLGKGRVPWNKGKTLSDDHKRKMSESHLKRNSP